MLKKINSYSNDMFLSQLYRFSQTGVPADGPAANGRLLPSHPAKPGASVGGQAGCDQVVR